MLFIFDKYDNLLTILDSSSKGACPYYEPFHEEELNGPQKLEFVVPATHPDAQYVVEENQVAFKDEDGYFRLFVIREIEETDGAETAEKHVYCEPAMLELENEPIEDIRPQNTTAQYALTRALEKTRWRVGEVAELGTNSTNFYYESVLSAIQKIIETWGGELRDRIEVQGNRIVGRYIDLLARRGQDTGKRFEIGKDLESIRRKVVAYPVTALYGRGNGQETEEGGYTRKLTFADVEWKKSDGKPVDKPKGQEWVGDPDSLQKYGIPNGDGTLRHRFDFVDFDEDDPEKLLERTWEELQKRKEPLVEYQLDVIVLEHFTGYEHEKVRLGDSIVAIDKNFANPIVIEARATKIRRNLLNKAEKTITFGNFIDKFSTQKRLEQLETKINDRSGIWDQVEQPVDDTDFPDIVPPTPSYLNASGGFKTVMLEWDYDPSSYIAAYEVYGSQVQGFTPDSSNLLFRGKTSTWVHQVDTNQTWYYRVRAINTHGTAGGFSQEASAQTARIISDDILFGAINAQHLADLAVTAEKLANGAVTDVKIADRAVNNAKLADLSVSAEKLRDGVIDDKKLADLSVTSQKLADGSITTPKVADGAINTAKIVDDAITQAKIAAGAVGNTELDRSSANKIQIGTNDIINGAISNLKIASNAVDSSKLADLAVIAAKLADGSVTNAKIANNAVDNAKLADLSVTAQKLADSAVTSSKIDSGAKQEIVDTANQYTNTYAEKKIAKGNTAPSNPAVGDLWIDTSVTPNLLKRWTGSMWQKLAPTTASEIGAVDLSTYNTKVQQLTNDIAAKADATWVNGQLQLKENAITKSSTAPSNPATNQLWLDTSVTPNVLKRWNGSAWVKVTPTSAGEVGAYTKTEVDNALNSKVSVTQYTTDMNGVVTQLNDHESRITQNEQEIATKVSNTTYQQDKTTINNNISQLQTKMSSAETSITQLSNQIALKANASDVYTKQQIDTSLAGKADVSTVSAIEQRVSQAEAQLTVQAGEIASKVSRTEFESLQIGGRNLIRNSGNFKTLGNWTSNGSGTSITLTQKDGFSVLEGIKSITGENVYGIKNNTEYVFSAEVMFDRDVNIASNTPLHCHVAISGDVHGGKESVSLISKDTVVKANTWSVISVKIKTKSDVTITHFKPFIYGLADGTKFWVKWWKLEEGNKPTAWTPAPEDVDGQISGLDTRLSTAESSITQLSNQITLKVNQSQYDIDVNNLKSRMSSAESQLTIQAGQIATKVEKDGVISAINQTPESIKIQASKIELIGTTNIQDGAINSAKIANLAVGTGAIQDGAITNAKIANAAVNSAKIANAAITSAHIANAAVGAAAIASAAIGTAHIQDGAITNAKISNLDASKITSGTIDANRIGANTITVDKLIVSDFTNLCENPDFEGDTVGSNPKGYTTNTSCRVADISGFTNGNGSNRALEIDAKNGSNNDIYSTNIFPVQEGQQFFVEAEARYLNTAGTGKLVIGFRRYDEKKTALSAWHPVVQWDGTKILSFTKKSGTFTVPAGTGYLQLWISFQNNGETTNKAYIDNIRVHRMANSELIVDGSITASKIAAGAITAGSAIISDGAITTAKIADAAITSAKIASLAVGTGAIQNAAITNAKIANLAVGTAAIADAAITQAKIAQAAIDTALIKDASITSAKIASLAVGNAAIQNAAITNAKIATAAVGTAQIQDAAITNAKIANLAVDNAKIANLHGSKITAGSITADKLSVTSLSAISANLGTVTAGTLQGLTADDLYIGNYGAKIDTSQLPDGTNAVRLQATSSSYIRSNANDSFSVVLKNENSFHFDLVSSYNDRRIKMGNVHLKGLNGAGRVGLEIRNVNDDGYEDLTAKNITATGGLIADRVRGQQDANVVLLGNGTQKIDNSNGEARWKQSDGNYIFQGSNGDVRIYVAGAVKHAFYANGTKSGGSIEIDGINWGMSPIDSPRVMIADLITDVPLNEFGVVIRLDDRLAKALSRYAVFPNNPTARVVEKGADYFVVTGEGLSDFYVLGIRVGNDEKYFENLTVLEEEIA
jgi:phage minor structural protein